MDEGGQHQNGRYKMDYFKSTRSPWNMMPQHPVKEQATNALVMNQKIMGILAERDAAIQERNQALAEKKEALDQRDEAIQQREQAIAERDKALMERDNAVAAIQYREEATNTRASRRVAHPVYHSNDMTETLNTGDPHVTDAFPITTVSADTVRSHQIKRTKENKAVSMKGTRSPRKVNRVGEDLNRHGATEGKKFKVDWDSQEVGLNLINFDESTMPVPVCSCTGVPRQCYKWGSGGWQSSCCTTIISCYPLPQMANKRHARVGGRKMSGSVFRKLLSRLAAEGHNLSLALDLKDYWARHGTNRYITIK